MAERIWSSSLRPGTAPGGTTGPSCQRRLGARAPGFFFATAFFLVAFFFGAAFLGAAFFLTAVFFLAAVFGAAFFLATTFFFAAFFAVTFFLGAAFFAAALFATFFLATAFHELHLKGLCYKDISLGNLFLRPGDGAILICDNDNVAVDGQGAGSVLGTPGFMAPEVLLGAAKPSASTDQFSLAVLLFRLLTRHDPFRGRQELAIRCLDEPARRRLYGEEALFIFDPNNPANRPDPDHHAAALVTWPIYPRSLQQLFEMSFGAGLRQPSQRPLTGQWKQQLARCLDQRRLCQHCGEEVFQDGPCWSCGQGNAGGLQLQLPQGQVAASPGNALYRHHFDGLHGERLDHPLAVLVAHPTDAALVGLRNLSDAPWQGQLPNGQRLEVEPGKTCNVAALQQLSTPAGPITPIRT